jgi:hypothetical protein
VRFRFGETWQNQRARHQKNYIGGYVFFAGVPGRQDLNETIELLAGYPFYISPKELYNMTIKQLFFWSERAIKRINFDIKKGLIGKY